ncbi:RNA polymerase II transcription elongation factor SpEAF, partial [Ophidiomyces ophidiicola]
MLCNELLKAKNDEIERCVSSRKRKLSQLYFATVNCLGTKISLQSEQYRRQEAAFLDANDITKGRWYHSSTLPLQPNVIINVAEGSPTHPLPVADEEPYHHDVPGCERAPPSDGLVLDTPEPKSHAAISPDSSNTSSAQLPAVPQATPASLPSQSPSLSSSSNIVPESGNSHAGHSQFYPKSASSQNRGPNSSTSISTLGQQRGASETERLRPASINVAQDAAPSSPISTGPSSVHTSATDRSPASTSTEESVAYPDERPTTGSRELLTNTISQCESTVVGKVPTTPDEQLKLEAAVSENSTIPLNA